MKEFIGDFSGQYTNYDLNISALPLADYKNGNKRLGTTRPHFDSSAPVEIVINSRYLNQMPNSFIATVFLHEALHAELIRKVRSIGGYENLNDSNFPGIYDYWIRHGEESQHEQMAAHYLDTIANGIASFDGYNKSIDYYKSLALKLGLQGTVTWKGLSQERKDKVDADIDNALDNGSYQCN